MIDDSLTQILQISLQLIRGPEAFFPSQNCISANGNDPTVYSVLIHHTQSFTQATPNQGEHTPLEKQTRFFF